MLFAIDFDGTWSRDACFFHNFVTALRMRGHDAILVTCRSEECGNDVVLAIAGLIPIVFTDHRPKREECDRLGLRVDVWIDDMPETIVRGR